MVKRREFRTIPGRDAWHVVRGYAYQVDQTICRWAGLRDDEVLELEAGEDIDQIQRFATERNEKASERLLEQVKHIDGKITLKSAPSLTAISNFLYHSSRNPKSALTFRFCTTALPAVERPSRFFGRIPGIIAWEKVRTGMVMDKDGDLIGGIRATLRDASRPKELVTAAWQRFCSFRRSVDPEAVTRVVRRFEWATGVPATNQNRRSGEQILVDLGHVPDQEFAARLYRRLFVHVVRCLSKRGRKKLTRAQFLAAKRSEEAGILLSRKDRELLLMLDQRILNLGTRVEGLEQFRRVAETQLKRLVAESGLGAIDSLARSGWAIEAALPPATVPNASRDSTVAFLANAAGARAWLSLYGGIGTGKTELARQVVMSGEFVSTCYTSLRDLDGRQSLVRLQSAVEVLARPKRGREDGPNPVTRLCLKTVV